MGRCSDIVRNSWLSTCYVVDDLSSAEAIYGLGHGASCSLIYALLVAAVDRGRGNRLNMHLLVERRFKFLDSLNRPACDLFCDVKFGRFAVLLLLKPYDDCAGGLDASTTRVRTGRTSKPPELSL